MASPAQMMPAAATPIMRKQREERREEIEAAERARRAAMGTPSEYGASDAGAALLARKQDEYETVIKRWLSADPLTPTFPTLSIQAHSRLQALRAIIRELQPPMEDHQDGDTDPS